MDYFAAAATQAPPAVVPAVQARRGNGRRLGVALVAVVVVLVAIWLAVGAGKPSLASVDRPNGSQRPLLTSIITHDPTGGPSFEIDLPAAPDSASVATQPASDGSVSFGDVRLGGSRFGALLLVRGGQDWANSARKSLEQEAARGESTQVLAPAGHIRRTLVGATPAYAREFVVGNGEHLREFRFSHDGYVYGAGIMYRPGDTVSLDTALAALRTLRWVS